ncbi:MAG: GTP cyclohydrolase I FolE [Alphaproteobacteria bacterium]|nr:MAG: GTP cyclohydrolase I FolE [Alphaproteobacteria bacterium]
MVEKNLSGTAEKEFRNGVSNDDAKKALELLLKWIGENPQREGLKETPKRVLKAYKEWFAGYNQNPVEILSKTFEEIDGYREMISLKDVGFHSFCEHHFAPIIGKVHIGYIPNKKVVGLSKLARLIEMYARRLQVQEKMTAEIGNTLQNHLDCLGVGVVVEAEHHCMCSRGIKKQGSLMKTSHFTGIFLDNSDKKNEFMRSIS